MMIDPVSYRESFENKSLKYLISERDLLLQEMRDFENDNVDEMDYFASPSPSTIYMCDYLYLKEVCDLIGEKLSENNSFEKFEDLKE